MKPKREENKRLNEIRVLVQQSMYDQIIKMAGEYRTVSEVIREILAKHFENNSKGTT